VDSIEKLAPVSKVPPKVQTEKEPLILSPVGFRHNHRRKLRKGVIVCGKKVFIETDETALTHVQEHAGMLATAF
jgi:hypothetical protein